MNPEQIILSLTSHIRNTVKPHLGTWQSRRVSGEAASGDVTFAIDDIAEEAIIGFIKDNNLSIAYYSEDKGLMEFGSNPAATLIIDPIDGTRPAINGLETCVVSVAWAKYASDVTIADVEYACLAEIKGDEIYYAARGKGVKRQLNGQDLPVYLLPIKDIEKTSLSFELTARPIKLVSTVLADIIDHCALQGGCFVFNSTAYALSRMVTGQLAAVIDVGSRILREYPNTRGEFIELGRGRPLGLFTYDIAAAALIVQEAGGIVTDAYGNSLDNVPLLDTSENNITSIIAASTHELHEKLLRSINRGITLLSSL